MAVVAYVLLTLGVFAVLGLRRSWSKNCEPRRRQCGAQRSEGAAHMSLDNIIGLALAAVFAVYMVAALFFPERF